MMYWYGDHGMSGWGWALMTIGMIVFWGVLIAAGVALFRYLAHSGPQPNQGAPGSAASVRPPAPSSPETILAERYARGEIDENEYHTRLNTLRGAGNP